jgi:tetratricopeptide (TPR) repeat protein
MSGTRRGKARRAGGGDRAPRGGALHRYWALAPLLLLTLAALSPALTAGFINVDDPQYILDNPMVSRGLSGTSLRWALSAFHFGTWQPLAWLSHMLDASLFGLQPRGHHLTSLILHAANAGLLFLVLRRMTGLFLPSLAVAALFAVHPLRVESVAWVAERKDVLAGLFWLLTMAAYLRYVHRPDPGRYAAVALVFGLGLTAKPMLVTLPLVLLLCDYWPLGRFRRPAGRGGPGKPARPVRQLGALLLEKTPLLALSLISSLLTLKAQQAGGAVSPTELVTPAMRVANAAQSVVWYLFKAAWPADLAFFYPYEAVGLLDGRSIAAAGLLCLATLGALTAARRPYLAVGWLWYIVALLPVAGLVQIGAHSRAARFTYLPQIGVALLFVWAARDVASRSRPLAKLLPAAALAAVLVLAATTYVETGFWRDSVTLHRRSLAVTGGNERALLNLGKALLAEGKPEEAEALFREALRLRPDSAEAMGNLASVLAGRGRRNEALALDLEALRLDPTLHWVHNNLGNLLQALGRFGEAVESYRAALRLRPDYAAGHANLGLALARAGKTDEAAEHLAEALRLNPGHADAHYNLAVIFDGRGRRDEAREHYEQAVRLRPDHEAARRGLAAPPPPR